MTEEEKVKIIPMRRDVESYRSMARRYLKRTRPGWHMASDAKVWYVLANGEWVNKDSPGFYGMITKADNVQEMMVEVCVSVPIEIVDRLVCLADKNIDEIAKGETDA
jgi:hypothetical protein